MVKSYALKQFLDGKGVIYKICRRRYRQRSQTGGGLERIREIGRIQGFPCNVHWQHRDPVNEG